MIPFFKLAALILQNVRSANINLRENIHLCELNLNCYATETQFFSADSFNKYKKNEKKERFLISLLNDLKEIIKKNDEIKTTAKKNPDCFI